MPDGQNSNGRVDPGSRPGWLENLKGLSKYRTRLQLLAPLLRRLPQEAALQAVDEGADGDEGAQLFVAGLRAVAAVELAQAVARHLGEGEARIADMAKLAVETQEGDAVDTDVDAEFFLVMIGLFGGFWAAKVDNEKLF